MIETEPNSGHPALRFGLPESLAVLSLATCPNCGAPVPPGAWNCRYCGASTDPSRAGIPSLAEFSTLVQSGEAALLQALPGLAAALEAALPGAVQLEREGGFLRRSPRIRSVTALVGEHRFALSRRDGRLVTSVEHEVRGVVLRHDTLPPAEWLARLGEGLRELAGQARATGPALARLLGPGPPS